MADDKKGRVDRSRDVGSTNLSRRFAERQVLRNATASVGEELNGTNQTTEEQPQPSALAVGMLGKPEEYEEFLAWKKAKEAKEVLVAAEIEAAPLARPKGRGRPVTAKPWETCDPPMTKAKWYRLQKKEKP